MVLVISALALIAFAAGFVHSALGFGFGIVAVTLLPLVIDARQTQILVSVASVPVMMGAAWAYREGADKRTLVRALVGALVGLPLGLWLFQSLNMDWLVRGTGAAILLMVGLSIRNRLRQAGQADSDGGYPALAGMVGGFLAGAVSIAGPPIVAYALQQNWEQVKFKAFVNQFLLAVCFYKVAGLIITQDVTLPILYHSMGLALVAMLGIWVGAKFSERLSSAWFRVAVAVALIAIAIVFLIRGTGDQPISNAEQVGQTQPMERLGDCGYDPSL